jgi:hypothetical protein
MLSRSTLTALSPTKWESLRYQWASKIWSRVRLMALSLTENEDSACVAWSANFSIMGFSELSEIA